MIDRPVSRVLALLLVPVLGAALVAQQSPPPALGTSAISGVVVDGSTNKPVAEAIVALAGAPLPGGYQTRQLTDAKGRFAFPRLPDSDAYQISVSKLGWLEGGYGRDSGPADPLRPIVVRDSWAANLTVPIWRPSAISGVVRDETGEPVVGVFVRALARVAISGRGALAVGPTALTDDHGAYRLSGLFAGRYIIQVPSVQLTVPAMTLISAPRTNAPEGVIDVDETARLVVGRYPLPPPSSGGRVMSYGPAFHPAESAAAQATTIEIAFGEDRGGIDVALAPMPAVRVSGTVDGPSEALAGLTLRLIPTGLEDLGLGAEVGTALVAADGAFTFVNVPAGTYTLDAPMTFNEFTIASGPSVFGGSVGFGRTASLPSPPPASGWSRSNTQADGIPGVSLSASDFRNGRIPNYSGRTTVTVGGSPVTGVSLRLRAAATLNGRIVMEPDPKRPPPPSPPRFFVTMEPAGGQARLGLPQAKITPLGESEFEIAGIQSGEYCLHVASGGWLVKSILWRGRDFSAAPIDTSSADDLTGVVVTMTNAVPILSGSVGLPNGSLADAGLVVAFPVDPAQRVNAGLSPSRMKATPILSTGAFRLTTLPAGDYFVAAVDKTRATTWRDPAFLSMLERRAAHVTLAWGQTTTQNLTVVVVR
jgi:hypothetical protein